MSSSRFPRLSPGFATPNGAHAETGLSVAPGFRLPETVERMSGAPARLVLPETAEDTPGAPHQTG